MKISERIINWYNKHKRELPWRLSSSAYYIWISEIILQQTRVNQGLKYYHRFIQEFPDIKLLAAAPEDKILKMWQGLGYYSRARNLHAAAKTIVNEFNGEFPDKYKDILSLKGIGEYTASAIASIAFNQPYPVVDGNVYRILSRLYGVFTPIDSAAGKKEFRAIADEILDRQNSGIHNQALMEIGAIVCKPKKPDCHKCPLAETCFAFQNKKIEKLPVKQKKQKIRNRYFNYFHIKYNNRVLIVKRRGKDIWKNLYELPLIEVPKKTSPEQLFSSPLWAKIIGKTDYIIETISKEYIHILSHQKIHARFVLLKLKHKHEFKELQERFNAQCISSAQIKTFAVSRLTEKYLSNKTTN